MRINGSSEVLRFVIDTGSGINVISDETAQKFNLSPVARGGKARAIGGTGRFEIVYGFLNSMDIGEARIANVPVYIRKFYQTNEKVDGYIGLSMISKFLTVLDYGNKTFSLTRQKKKKPTKKETVNLFAAPTTDLSVPVRMTSSGFLSGEVQLEGIPHPLNFIIDTGATVSVIGTDLTQAYEMNRYAETSMLRVYGAAGVTENVMSLNLPRLSFGINAQDKIQAAVLDLQIINEAAGFDQSGILGGNFLRHYRLTFDFKNFKVTLEPTRPLSFKTLNERIISRQLN